MVNTTHTHTMYAEVTASNKLKRATEWTRRVKKSRYHITHINRVLRMQGTCVCACVHRAGIIYSACSLHFGSIRWMFCWHLIRTHTHSVQSFPFTFTHCPSAACNRTWVLKCYKTIILLVSPVNQREKNTASGENLFACVVRNSLIPQLGRFLWYSSNNNNYHEYCYRITHYTHTRTKRRLQKASTSIHNWPTYKPFGSPDLTAVKSSIQVAYDYTNAKENAWLYFSKYWQVKWTTIREHNNHRRTKMYAYKWTRIRVFSCGSKEEHLISIIANIHG